MQHTFLLSATTDPIIKDCSHSKKKVRPPDDLKAAIGALIAQEFGYIQSSQQQSEDLTHNDCHNGVELVSQQNVTTAITDKRTTLRPDQADLTFDSRDDGSKGCWLELRDFAKKFFECFLCC